MRDKVCACNTTKCQFRQARSISTMLQRYINISMTVVLSIVVFDSTVNHSPMRQFEKNCPSHFDGLLTSHKILNEFLLCRIILQHAIGRHPSSSCFFSHFCIANKELRMSLSLLTKSCRLPVVQSTTTCIIHVHCGIAFMQCHIHWLYFPLGNY